jgi:hypothetical protein
LRAQNNYLLLGVLREAIGDVKIPDNMSFRPPKEGRTDKLRLVR